MIDRIKPDHKKRLCVLGAVAVLLLFAVPAVAQNPSNAPVDTSFSIQLFQPAPGPMNFFSVESPELGPDMKPSVGLIVSYEHRPLVLYNCVSSSKCGDSGRTIDAVQNYLTADVLASFNFLKWFQVGLAIPVTLYQHGTGFIVTEQYAAPGNSYTAYFLGDMRIHFKARVIGTDGKNGPFLAIAGSLSLPLAHWIGNDVSKDVTSQGAHGYGGDGFISGTVPKVLFGYRFIDALRIGITLGALWRQKSTILSTDIGHSLTYGGAIAYQIIPAVEVLAEVYGEKSLISEHFVDTQSAPLLFLGGGRFRYQDFLFYVGAGGGIVSGIGVPQFQVIGGFAWAPQPQKNEWVANEWDRDGDGIANDVDKCPDQPEDIDGFQDDDGCPDPDNDGDGILDGYDSCPNEPEDKDGFQDDDGCPDLDHDEDGIKEPDDKCPDQAEDFDGFQDDDGCPDPDNDGDGILDTDDYCPNDPEDIDGFEDTDGCPEGGKSLVVVTRDKIELKEMIQFKTASTEITGQQSFDILNIVAGALAANPTLRISIQGHTDDRGNAAKNRALSLGRANAVKAYLVSKGVAEDRLETAGYGPDKPVASNKTEAGRTANRRVEFLVIKQKQPEAAPAPAKGGTDMDFTGGGSKDEGDMDFTK